MKHLTKHQERVVNALLKNPTWWIQSSNHWGAQSVRSASMEKMLFTKGTLNALEDGGFIKKVSPTRYELA